MYLTRFIYVTMLVGILPLHAQQGNYKFNNYGNRSILLSGNVTGSVEDIALAYYNPARLTEVQDTRFSFNAKAYQLTSLKLSNILGEESSQGSTNFNGVPSMAGGTFKLFGTRFAYSFLSKTRNNIGINYSSKLLNGNILNSFPGDESYKVRLNLKTNVKDEWIGLTWATKVTDRLSLGVSGFSSVYRYEGNSILDYTVIGEEGNIAFYQNGTAFRQDSYGLVVKMGANYNFPKFDVGLNINLPYLEVYQQGRFNYNKTIAGIDSETDLFLEYKLKDLTANRKEPFGVSVGSGIPIGLSKLHLNVDYVAGIANYQRMIVPDIDTGGDVATQVLFDEKRKHVLNFGLGAEVFITEKLKTYGSFTTDFNSFDANPNIFDLSSDGEKSINIGANFIHGSVGVDWKLSWASIILGTTYTAGSSEFISPLKPTGIALEVNQDELTKIDYNRWQFVIGLDLPFLDNKMKGIIQKEL